MMNLTHCLIKPGSLLICSLWILYRFIVFYKFRYHIVQGILYRTARNEQCPVRKVPLWLASYHSLNFGSIICKWPRIWVCRHPYTIYNFYVDIGFNLGCYNWSPGIQIANLMASRVSVVCKELKVDRSQVLLVMWYSNLGCDGIKIYL